MKCAKCGAEFEGKFCTNCGASAEESNAENVANSTTNNQMMGAVKKKKPIYKKWWFYVIIAVVVIAIASSAGKKGDNKPANSDRTASQTQSPSRTSQPVSTPAPTPTPVPKEATIEEQVLLDDKGVKITAKGIESGILGTELKLLIENNSGKDLTFQCRETSINGYMIISTMSDDVADGKKVNTDITFLASDMKMCGIDTIADIELYFHIFTSSNLKTYFDSDVISIKTSKYEGFEYKFDPSGEVLYDDNGIKIVSKGIKDDVSLLGKSLILYIENNTDKTIMVQSRDTSVNGYMITDIFSCDVAPGKHAIDDITFLSSSLEENGIDKIESVELSFVISDANSFKSLYKTGKINITF